jgi:hypothetical protein
VDVKEEVAMVGAFPSAVPPAVLPPGSTIVVSLGAPLVIALLVVAFVVIAAVLLQGALSAAPSGRAQLRVEGAVPGAASSRHAA